MGSRRIRNISTVALSGIILLAASVAEGQTQIIVPLQGVLTDANGEPVSATVPMTFSLYANSTAAAPLWTETQAIAVGAVFPGVYTARLGASTPLPAEHFRDNPAVHIGLRVGTDTADIGRYPLDTTPKAAITTLGGAAGGGGFNQAAADPLYVNITGDTMTGPLVLPQGGLRVGTNQLVTDSSGRLGLGATPTTHRFEVTGGSTRLDGRAAAGLRLDLNGAPDFLVGEVAGVNNLVQIGSLFHNISTNALGVGRRPSTVATSFIKLDVAGPIAINGNAVLSRDATTVAIGDIASADGTLASLVLRTNDTTRMTIDGVGNVGIGTRPVANTRLHIAGGNLKLGPGPEILSNTLALSQHPNGNAFIWIPDFGEARILFKSNAGGSAGNRIAFLSNGRVGIGTTSPASALDVRGQVRAESICFDADCRSSWAAAGGPWSRSANRTVLRNVGDQVGIGTTVPDARLHLYTNANANVDLLRLESDPATAGRRAVGMNFVTDNGSGGRSTSARIWSQFGPTAASDDANLHLAAGNGTPAHVTVKGNGNVGIATVAPAARLHVNGDMIVQGSFTVGNDTNDCDGSRAGRIRFTGATFEGCDGTAWRGLGQFASGAGEGYSYAFAQTNAALTLSGRIPWDDTAPLNTEGSPLLSVTITPRRAASLLVLEGTVHWVEPSNHSDYMTVALFRDGNPEAIASATDGASNGNGRCTANGGYDQICTMPIRFTIPARTMAPVTFRMRAGLNGGAVRINQGIRGRRLGGTLYSTLSVTEAGGVGGAINYEFAQTNTALSLPGRIPWDDSPPLETEGNSLLSVTITPRSATSLVVLDGTVNWTEPSNHSDYMTVAIFRDGNPAAIAVATDAASNGNGRCTGNRTYSQICTMPIRFIVPAGTTSPITFRLRVGLNGGAVAINQGFNGRKLGGSLYSTFSATEVAGTGGVANFVRSQTSTPMTMPARIPWDDTPPLETEGNALLAVTITPSDASSLLVLDGTVNWTEPANHSDYMTVAIFRSGTPQAIASTSDAASNSNGRCTANSTYTQICTTPIRFTTPAGTTAPVTFRLRVGLNGGAVAINQSFRGRRLGGRHFSTFSVAEVPQ